MKGCVSSGWRGRGVKLVRGRRVDGRVLKGKRCRYCVEEQEHCRGYDDDDVDQCPG